MRPGGRGLGLAIVARALLFSCSAPVPQAARFPLRLTGRGVWPLRCADYVSARDQVKRTLPIEYVSATGTGQRHARPVQK